jgi:UPF0271 protein
LQHVKPHGALYTMAARDGAVAAAIARAVVAFDSSLLLLGPPGSELLEAARSLGLRVAAEAFVDRAYRSNRTLVPRSEAGAVIHDSGAVLARALKLVKEHIVVSLDGSPLVLEPDTLCIHGDTPGASVLAASVRAGLEANGITVRRIGDREPGT